MHEQDVGCGSRGHGARRRRGRRGAVPPRERLVHQGPDLGLRDVAGHDQQGAARAQPLRREADDVVPQHGLEALGRRAAAIGVVAVNLLREESRGHGRRSRQLDLERGQRLRARELQLAHGEARVQRDVAEQLEREIDLVAQHVGRDRQEVGVRRRRQTAAHSLDGGRDLIGGARLAALGQELRDQVGQPFLAGRVVNGTGPEAKRHRHNRLLVVLDDGELQPVGEGRLLERREADRRERRGLRWAGRERILGGQGGQADGRTGGQKEQRRHHQRIRCSSHGPPVRPSACPTVLTTITTAFAGSRYLVATRRMSSAVTAR